MSQMANTPVGDGAVPRLSPSVAAINNETVAMTATGLAHALYEGHTDYPQREKALEVMRRAVTEGPSRRAEEWIADVLRRLDGSRLAELPADQQTLHGKLLVYGLTRVDTTLYEVLSTTGVLDALRKSVTPDPELLFSHDPDQPPSDSERAPTGFIVRLQALGENAEYGFGFLVRDGFVVTSARYRGQFPPLLQVELVDSGAVAQASHLTEATVADVEGFQLIDALQGAQIPSIGTAKAQAPYRTVVESSPGQLVAVGGVVVSASADALSLQPDTSTTSAALDGAPVVVDGSIVGMMVVSELGEVRGVPIGVIESALSIANRSTPGPSAAQGASSGEFTARSLAVLSGAEALRIGCEKSAVHMEHLVAALLDSGGPLHALVDGAGMTNEGIEEFMTTREGVEWPGQDHRHPTTTPPVPPLPELSGHAHSALDGAKRIAAATGSALVDEIHLVFGALSVRNCSVIEALAAAEIYRDQLPLRLPSRGEVAEIRPDTAEGTDLLGLEREIGALAAVIAAKGVQPPLSIGLFGDWGSGKSFFMNQLESAIGALADRAKADPAGSMFCEHIVQLTFNAWHYMDVDLWANLAAEVFEQLAAAIDQQTKDQKRNDGEPTQRQRLLAAAIHTRDVIAEAERTRDAVRARLSETETMKDMLNERRADLDRRLDAHSIVTEAVANALDDESVKAQLNQAADRLGITNAKAVAGQVESQVIELRGAVGWIRALGLRWRSGGTKVQLLAAAIVVTVGVIVPLVVTQVEGSAVVRAVAGLAAAVSAVTAFLSPYLKKIHEVTTKVRDIRAEEIRKQEERLRQMRSDNEARLADAEALVKTKSAELAGIESELESMRADRRVKDFVDERSRSQDYSKHFGTVARARSDFTRLAKMFADAQQEIDDGFPRIDRIVLYIDDLDRCPEDKVVAVLQAVHLLLAMPLFVVVVGVDSRWLLHSLRQHARPFQDHEHEGVQLDDTMSDEERLRWQSTPLNYLEKIFQIPFAVRPMDSTGYQRLVDSLATASTNEARPEPDESSEPKADSDGRTTTEERSPPRPPATGDEATSDSPTPPATGPEQAYEATPPPATVVAPSSRFLTIERWERTAMKRLFPLIPSPRSAKRFVNIYRLLRATLTEEEFDQFVAEKGGDYEVVLLLLAMLTGHPSPTTQIMRDLLDDPRTAVKWWDFIGECKERCAAAAEAEPIEVESEDGRSDAFWVALADVKRSFPDVGTIDQARAWTKNVARYSFQSSRVLLDPPHGQ